MDYVTRQFIVLAKKLRADFRKLTESLHHDLAHLSDGLKNLKETISTQGKPDEKGDESDPIFVTHLRTDVPISVEDKTKRTIPEWIWAVFKGTCEIAGIFAVLFYTWVSYGNWQEQIDATNFTARQAELSRKSANESTKQFRTDERAWLGVQSYVCKDCKEIYEPRKDQFSPLQEIVSGEVTGTLVNSGKTPALRVRIRVWTTSGYKKDPIPAWRELDRPVNLPKLPKEAKAMLDQEESAETVVAPNASNNWSTGKTANGRLDTIPSETRVSYVIGRITYYDIFLQKQHATTFCLMNDFGANYHFCPTGNWMD
jgi:hypothetical protein